MTKGVIRFFSWLLITLSAVQMSAQSGIEVVNIENPAVRAYMADSTYFVEPNYKVNIVRQYYDTRLYGDHLDRPSGKKVSWTTSTPAGDIQQVRVTVSESKDFSHPAVHYLDDVEKTTYEIKNLIPKRVYYYKVEEKRADGTVHRMAQGMFRTVGQVRMIEVEGARNVRDLGGWKSIYGATVRYGRLFRSANLDQIKQEGRHEFAGNMNVNAELDLRKESRLKESALGSDADFLLQPLPTKGGLYQNGRVLVKALEWIVQRLREGKNVDWHCAIGCDRCGKMSFMIEGLLGLCEEDLCRDFELSTFSNRYRPRHHIKSWIDEVKEFGEPDAALADCFYDLWLEMGASGDDMDYLLETMLEFPDENGLN